MVAHMIPVCIVRSHVCFDREYEFKILHGNCIGGFIGTKHSVRTGDRPHHGASDTKSVCYGHVKRARLMLLGQQDIPPWIHQYVVYSALHHSGSPERNSWLIQGALKPPSPSAIGVLHPLRKTPVQGRDKICHNDALMLMLHPTQV